MQKDRENIVNGFLSNLKSELYCRLLPLFDKHAQIIDNDGNIYENTSQIRKYFEEPFDKISYTCEPVSSSNGDVKVIVHYHVIYALNLPYVFTFKFKDQSTLIEKLIIDHKQIIYN